MIDTEEALDAEASLLSPAMTARLARLSLLARRLPDARRRGRRRTRRVGSGTDAIDKRGYVPGDDVRRIDWSAFARFERLLVRVVADEQPLRLGLLIDSSASMAYGAPSKLRQATRIAAGLAAAAIGAEDRVAVMTSAPRPTLAVRTQGGSLGLRRVLDALETIRAEGGTDLSRAARQMRGALGGRGLCVILSDLWDPAGALDAASTLRHLGHDVVLARVLSAFERAPEGLAGLSVEDEETGDLIELPPTGVDEAYREAFAAHGAELERGATELGAPLLSIDCAEPFDDVIGRALRAGVIQPRSIV